MSITTSILRQVLRLAPREFRERYGDDLVETYAARHADARARGRAAVGALAVREVAGLLVLVVRLRLGGRAATAADTRGPSRLDVVRQDVHFAVRGLRRNPAYAAAALVVLAVGIGANTAMFSAVNAFFFRPLPFADADRLVMLYETNPEFEWTDADAAPANVLDWRERVGAFDDVAAYSELSLARIPYVRDGEPVLLATTSVTGNFFSVLGVRAALGRTLTWEETWEGSDAVVLGDGVWRTHFGADPGIIDRTITLGSREVRVVGVMPAGFSFPNNETQVWMPWGWAPSSYDQVFFRRAHWVRPIARLAPGATFEQADAEFQAVVAQLQREFPETNRVMGAGMMPARDFLVRDVRRPLLILLGAVGLLLLLACANVANLTLVRAAGRGPEVALRNALGAGRGRIAAQMMTESVVLALAGGILGLGVGWAGVQAMQRLTPLGIEGATTLSIDFRVLLFTFAAAAVSGAVFGMVPTLRTVQLRGALSDEGRSGTRSRRGGRTANALVAAEVALAVLLVAAAGLMIQSFRNMRSVDPGFRADGVVAVQFTVPAARYPGRDEVVGFYDRLAASLEGRGGIERAGVVGQLPLNGTSWSSQFQAFGWPPDRVGFEIVHRRADAGYFDALEIPLIGGRMFAATDRPDGPFVILVNETFASTHFPAGDAIGQRIAYDRAANDSSTWYEIIGIVGDQRQVSTTQPARAEVFEHRSQDWGRTNWVVVRTAGDAMDAVPTIRAALREIDPLIPVAEARTLGDVRRESMAREQFILALLATFGGAALLLATVGVYAVAAQTARTRTREIGIRMALGAEGGSIVALMLRQAFVVIGLGLSAGVLVSLLATRALRTLLFGVEPTDPVTLAAVFLLLAAVAGLAVWLPAWRATRMDPSGVLRDG